MIGKNQLFVSRQHGHSVTTMWRTYAAWMEDALETDIALIQAAMNGDGRAIERVSNPQIELTLNAPAVAGLGTRLATRREAPEAQVPDSKGQKKWRRGWKPIWIALSVKLLVAQPLSERIILDPVHTVLELDDKVRILQALQRIGRCALGDGLLCADGLAESPAGAFGKHVRLTVRQELQDPLIGGQQSVENGEEIRVTQDMIEGVLKSCLTAQLRVSEIAI